VRTPERNYGPAKLTGGTSVTPLARRLAVENGIDLGAIAPSGLSGRIVARDVAAAIAAKPAPLPRRPLAVEIMALYRDVPHEVMPLDGPRRGVAMRLVEAAQTIPHLGLTADIEIGKLLALREEVNAAAALKLSVNDFVIKAWAAALMRVPAANAVWADDRILHLHHANIGVAVASEDDTMMPVVRAADVKPLSAIATETREFAARIRKKTLGAQDCQGGASAIYNLGRYGVREFTNAITPPHATALAIGAARRQAIEQVDGGVGFISVMSVTLACDRRIVDATLGATLLAAFKRLVEQPVAMLV
jgi:pyruvate dehydrogenase E2 component (dihydrolipoamide acetyltransferase)